MKFKEVLEKIKVYAPLGVSLVIAACVVISLSGYQTKASEPSKDKKHQVSERVTDTETEDAAEDTQTATGSFELADGVYKGSATGFSGPVTVAVTIMDKKIISIDILSSTDDEAFFNRAKGVIDRIIASQSFDVDVVSGATYSSNGIIGAVKNALTGEKDNGVTGKSKQESTSESESDSSLAEIAAVQDASAYKDGTYYGTGKGFAGTMKVKVDISGGKIASISIVSTKDGDSYVKSASSLLDTIVEKQSTNVDTVSGATFSSRGIIAAVRSALSQAAVSDNTVGNNTDKQGAAEASGNGQTDENSSGSASEQGTEGTLPYVDGIYYGTAEGYKGDIRVAVVIQDKTLKAILVTEKQDDEPFITNAMDVLKNMMKKQSADVDTVSGATYSSKGLIGAVKAAFEEARKTTAGENTGGSNSDSNNSNDNNSNIAGEEDKAVLLKLVQSQASLDGAQYTQLSWYLLQIRLGDAQEVLESAESTKKDVSCAQEKLQAAINALQKNDTSTNVYEDGTYDVSTLCIPDDDMDFSAYNLSMKVTIANDRIVSITDVKGDGDSQNVSYIKKAADGTKNQPGMVSVLTSQTNADSIDFSSIDTVSHATCTSKAIIDGCKSALEAAKKK
ncbi:FMN-binding protein [[Eubacterium] rectale]|uniref:FMN-binding protein n=1 Tax=Agathobacter rectalis TaxID=39491 RepID=A0A7X2MB09_9FIRM|nr:FMN-binding protein [Agathobacter rectalis]MSC54936.1 FMN-binding protein [Agathobacter rectalis]MSC88316.1 FMN-binding protein [Agathobacter rectalis]MSD10370.1 FMN-binding protein [Agathobacter rectalis]MSD18992.1 FMN-binding protein [Agathobacter rectalis]MSD21785.1 FMN-binding protein [Agathobacter rectalis]